MRTRISCVLKVRGAVSPFARSLSHSTFVFLTVDKRGTGWSTLILLFVASLRVQCLRSLHSQCLKVFLCLMFVVPVLRNTWMYTVNVHTHKVSATLPFCPSRLCPSFSFLHTNIHTHMHKPAHCILNPSVRWKCRSP